MEARLGDICRGAVEPDGKVILSKGARQQREIAPPARVQRGDILPQREHDPIRDKGSRPPDLLAAAVDIEDARGGHVAVSVLALLGPQQLHEAVKAQAEDR
ncbi:MAG: hypothetical protein IPI35_27820 [Deltaproteobacteria bacterium]|nr:hypothetical protein [Deltaproteobacteria bacterium]